MKLLGFYVFSDEDYTSAFKGKGKAKEAPEESQVPEELSENLVMTGQ